MAVDCGCLTVVCASAFCRSIWSFHLLIQMGRRVAEIPNHKFPVDVRPSLRSRRARQLITCSRFKRDPGEFQSRSMALLIAFAGTCKEQRSHPASPPIPPAPGWWAGCQAELKHPDTSAAFMSCYNVGLLSFLCA